MCSNERNGQITSGTRSVTGGSRRSPTRRSSVTPASAARRAHTSSIARDESTPITRIPSAPSGTAIRPVPTPSSTTGPPERRASQVEGDVPPRRSRSRGRTARYRVVTAQKLGAPPGNTRRASDPRSRGAESTLVFAQADQPGRSRVRPWLGARGPEARQYHGRALFALWTGRSTRACSKSFAEATTAEGWPRPTPPGGRRKAGTHKVACGMSRPGTAWP